MFGLRTVSTCGAGNQIRLWKGFVKTVQSKTYTLKSGVMLNVRVGNKNAPVLPAGCAGVLLDFPQRDSTI